MMKAAVYKKTSKAGVSVVEVPKPTLHRNMYDPNSGKYAKQLILMLLTIVSGVAGVALGLCRTLFRSVPRPYGEFKDRHMILVKVCAVGVNPVDAKRLYGDKLPHLLHPIVQWFVEGRVCGIDYSGIISEIPNSYRGLLRVGDAVYGTMPPFVGSFAEYVLAPSDFLALKPNNISFEEAAVLPLGSLTVMQAFEDFNLGQGQKICIIGASGGTGHLAVQFAKIRGSFVTAICSSRNAELVESYGVKHLICYDNENPVSRMREIVSAEGGFDIIFDTVSSADPRDSIHSYESKISSCIPPLLAAEGVYITLGGHVSDWFKAHVKRYLGIDLFGKNRILHWVRFPASFQYLNTLRRHCESGSLKVWLSESFAFSDTDVQQAFLDVMSRRTVGKIAIRIHEISKSMHKEQDTPPDLN